MSGGGQEGDTIARVYRKTIIRVHSIMPPGKYEAPQETWEKIKTDVGKHLIGDGFNKKPSVWNAISHRLASTLVKQCGVIE